MRRSTLPLIAVLIATAATSLFLGLTGFAQSLFNQRLGALMGIDFQQRLLQRVHSQDLAFFDRWQTGEILATISLPATQTGSPSTYRVDGRQFIVMMVSDGRSPAELIALALPDA